MKKKKHTFYSIALVTSLILGTSFTPATLAIAEELSSTQTTEENTDTTENSDQPNETIEQLTNDNETLTNNNQQPTTITQKDDSESKGTVTVKYVNQDGEVIGSNELTGNIGDEYQATAPMYVDGYAVDVNNLPPGANYTGNETFLITGNFTKEEQVIIFNYYAEIASANIQVIDIDTDNVVLGNTHISGRLGTQPEDFDFYEYLAEFVERGYELVETDYPLDGTSPFQVRDKVKEFTIKLKHSIENIEEYQTIIRHIKMVGPDGIALYDNKYDIGEEHTFKRILTVNNVTHENTHTEWSNNGIHTFESVDTPLIPGYETETKSVLAEKGGLDYGYQIIEVPYTPKSVKAAFEYYDIETDTIVATSTPVEGKFDTEIAIDDNETLKSLQDQGYVLAEGQEIPTTVKLDVDGTKLIRINLDHGKSFDGEIKEVTRTINFEATTGKKLLEPIKQVVTYKKGIQKDLVTGEETTFAWEVDGKDSFEKIEVPNVVGYTPDTNEIDEILGVQKDDADIVFTVMFEPNDVSAKIEYFDTFLNEVIEVVEVTGKFDETIPSNEQKINELLSKHYTIIENPISIGNNNSNFMTFYNRLSEKPNTTSIFDVDGTKEVQVRLGHEVKDGTSKNKEVKRIVNLIDEKGNILQEIKQIVNFTQTTGIDMVTGEEITSPWIGDKTEFEAIELPKLKGYSTSEKHIPSKNVSHDTKDEIINITYKKLSEKPNTINPNNESNTNKHDNLPNKKVTHKNSENNELPKTSESNTIFVMLTGILAISIATISRIFKKETKES